MSPAQLCKVERGRNEPTASTLRRIADALDAIAGTLAAMYRDSKKEEN